MFCNLYHIKPEDIINIIHFDPAKAIKVTIVRPIPSGSLGETDVYGAQQHTPLMKMSSNYKIENKTSWHKNYIIGCADSFFSTAKINASALIMAI